MPGPDRGDVPADDITLPGGTRLHIRAVAGTDTAALHALFAGLDATDLYRRFFQARVPPEHVVADMASPHEHGGVGLVAELVDGGAPPRLVAEAAFVPLPDGDGELGITVARDARGWLGPYLLGRLAAEAASRGIANLEADVLCENRPMLALAQGRGYAAMGHADSPAIVRVVMSTTGRVPSWPGHHDRLRLLAEVPGARWHAEGAARSAGFDVRVCPGPGGRRARCPALRGSPCPLAEGADVVVDALGTESELGRRLLHAHERLHTTPVHVEHAAASPPRRGRRAVPVTEEGELRLLQTLASRSARRGRAPQRAARR